MRSDPADVDAPHLPVADLADLPGTDPADLPDADLADLPDIDLAGLPAGGGARPHVAIDDLALAHARTLEKAVSGEFERRSRRMAFGSAAGLCGLAAGLLQDFAEDLLNDLLLLADRDGAPPGPEWVMTQLTAALVHGAAALEEAAPAHARASVANVLQICRVDFEWRCRATLGLPSAATLDADPGSPGR